MKSIKYSYSISTLILLALIFQPVVFAETAVIASLPSTDGQEFKSEDSLSALDEDPLDWEFEKKEEVAKKKEEKKKAEWVAQPIKNEKEIRIVQGNSQVLRFSGTLKRIAASDPDIADVVVIGASEILITTRKKGTTNLIVWDTDDNLFNYQLIVMGDPSTLKAAIDGISTKENLEVFPTQKGFVVKGNVSTVEEQSKIEAAAKAFSDESVSLVSVQDAKQILLEIRFIEITGSDDFNFGIDGHYIGEKAGFAFLGGATGATLAGDGVADGALNVLRSGFTFPALDGSGASPLISGGFQDQGNRVNYFIKALEARTDARIIARPNLLVRDGEEASFLVGGEFPVPVITDNSQNIQYKEFGTQLTYRPEILADGLIRLTVDTEVSQLDFANGVTLNNFLVPAVSARRTSTKVELSNGNSLVIGGLIQQRKSEVESGTPVLRRIPVLGKLFQSTTTDYSNTELIVLVTPKIVDSDKHEFKEKELPENSNSHRVMNMDVKSKVKDLPSVSEMIKANNDYRIQQIESSKNDVVQVDNPSNDKIISEAVTQSMDESLNRNMATTPSVTPNFQTANWVASTSRPLEIAVVEKQAPGENIDFNQLRQDLALMDVEIQKLFNGSKE